MFTAGQEPGRFANVPYGLKDKRLIGAYRTPTLRNVVLTGPYMHDGTLTTLKDVLRYFNEGISTATNPFIDPQLLGPPHADGLAMGQRLGLSPAELDTLELFLWSLRGNDLPAVLAEPPSPR